MASLSDCICMMDEGVERLSDALPDLPADKAKLSRLMLMVGSRLQEELEHTLKPHRLNHSEFLTLMILYSSPDGSSTPGELCDYTSQGATNMTRIGNALVGRGLVVRSASEEDRRRVRIGITPNGRRFVQKMLPTLFPRLSGMFVGFSESDQRQLGRLLRKLADNLDRLDEEIDR
ncbi:MAG: MarR family transcriptional regulator [Lysobacterales bacterium 13-68-4]|nr:MAG: MarR family transcriptional regulator [Xanthomonadales bacterium 15-68-25]OZB65345.1 MAG: MarR family transcriptional regulator [Xanthomonadales bacterium 14-68-21]OZB69079.1 MAG: MarR family transcriptional regulator [Xanthomonadales bacterium 13-68-4]